MTRSHFVFECEGETIACTLDDAAGDVGLLIVSGGNETRAGAFSGMAHLAERIAAAGFPVLRFDRRGIGDSTGENRGFRHCREDILAALATLREACPQVQRVVAFGNCDAASALMLMAGDRCDALVLSNPWTFDTQDGAEDEAAALPPPAAIRARYWAKLRNPRELWRLVTGGVDLARLRRGLGAAARKGPAPTSLAQEMAAGLDACGKPYVILIAGSDRTGQAFAASWQGENGELHRCAGAGHAYAEPHAREWLERQLLAMLRG